jgi:hypothetical protein
MLAPKNNSFYDLATPEDGTTTHRHMILFKMHTLDKGTTYLTINITVPTRTSGSNVFI